MKRTGTLIGYWWKSQKKRDHQEDKAWTGLAWLRIGTSGGLL
jgi:hypothetical protein